MPVPEPAPALVAAFWAPYASSIGTTGGPADVYCFGDSPAMADELTALVLGGHKRATAGVARQLDEAGLTVSVGDAAVIHDGSGVPVCVVRTTDVRRGAMSSVDEEFAWDEGEGDRTRSDWLRGHRAYVGRVFADAGWAPEEDPELVFERFTVVWPPAVADPVA